MKRKMALFGEYSSSGKAVLSIPTYTHRHDAWQMDPPTRVDLILPDQNSMRTPRNQHTCIKYPSNTLENIPRIVLLQWAGGWLDDAFLSTQNYLKLETPGGEWQGPNAEAWSTWEGDSLIYSWLPGIVRFYMQKRMAEGGFEFNVKIDTWAHCRR